MEPAWTQFESAYKNKVNLVMINVDEDQTPEFKKYTPLRGKDQSLPATLWVDSKGKVVHTRLGSMTAAQLGQETDAAARKAR